MRLSENLQKIHLRIGFGENHFTMERGSFSYDESFIYQKDLDLVQVLPDTPDSGEKTEVEQNAGWTLVYEDPEAPVEYLLRLTEENGNEVLTYLGARGKKGSDILVKPLLPNRFFITIPSDASEHFYGCGETYSEWDLKGQKVRIFTAEHQNSKRIAEKVEKIRKIREGSERGAEEGVKEGSAVSGYGGNAFKLPFDQYESYYVQPTVVSSEKYFLHCDTDRFMQFDFTKEDSTTLYLQQEPRIILGSAPSFPELSRKLRDLIGGQRRLPDWVFDGVIAATQRGCDEVDKKIRHLKEAGVSVCGIWCQDWCGCRNNTFGYQVMWNWSYDKDLYPDLPERIKGWKEEGVRFLGYINPFIALERDLYQVAHDKGYLVKNEQGEDYLVTITVFPAAMIDFTNPEAYDWYKQLIKENMIGIGLSGWMADFGEYLPTDAVLYNGEPAENWHNRWPAIWAKLNREAIEESGMEEEIFFFMRAGFTGSVKDSLMMWTGDQHVDWSMDDGIGSVIPATLSLAMSGFGMAHSDAGGYTTNDYMKRSDELLMRWEEMNVFSPVMRFHEGNQPWNNVQFDDSSALLEHLKGCADLHVKLKPYLKKCMEELVTDALPVQRPLFYHYEEEEAYTVTDEYLLGRDMLIAPVIEEGKTSREVYLPEDEWQDYWNGETYKGGHYLIEAPLGRIPVFVRTGNI